MNRSGSLSSGSDCWGLSYGYDRYANLLSASLTKCSGPTLSLSVDNTTNKITNTGFQYDADGNLTADGFSTFNWNAEGRMASTAGVNYTYDGDGRRVKKDNGKLYWYGINGQVLAESDLSGNITSEYIFFGGMRIARRDPGSGNTYYFVGDRLGNARVVTNSTGGVAEESDFYPFGQERLITDNLDNNYKFTQHERDSESGLDHTLYRQYGCNTGRWLSPDRVRGKPRRPQSWNRYAYAWNNPANFVDHDGAEPCPPGTEENPDFAEEGGPRCSPLEPWPFGSLPNLSGEEPPDPHNDPVAIAWVLQAQNDQARSYLAKAVELAKNALGEGMPCRKFFNTDNGSGMDPAKVLEDMMNDSDHGKIDFSQFVRGDAATRVADDAHYVGIENGREVWDKVDIIINSNPFTYGGWSGRDETWQDRARLLIHELGHVFNLLAGAGGSAFKYDAGDMDAEEYNAGLEKQCIGGP